MYEISMWGTTLDRVLSPQLMIISITTNQVFLDPKHPTSTALDSPCLIVLGQE